MGNWVTRKTGGCHQKDGDKLARKNTLKGEATDSNGVAKILSPCNKYKFNPAQ